MQEARENVMTGTWTTVWTGPKAGSYSWTKRLAVELAFKGLFIALSSPQMCHIHSLENPVDLTYKLRSFGRRLCAAGVSTRIMSASGSMSATPGE